MFFLQFGLAVGIAACVSGCLEEWISTRMGMFSSPSSSSGFSTQAGKRPVTLSENLCGPHKFRGALNQSTLVQEKSG